MGEGLILPEKEKRKLEAGRERGKPYGARQWTGSGQQRFGLVMNKRGLGDEMTWEVLLNRV